MSYYNWQIDDLSGEKYPSQKLREGGKTVLCYVLFDLRKLRAL